MIAPVVKTALYVEDHEPNVLLVQAIFAHRADIKIIIAATGRVGFLLAQERRPNLILLDLHLPDMHSEQFLQRMREMPILAKRCR
ncbi:MAG: response regulator [Gemmataceae bacterium]|nr:response regulator [Gemmataceae bacterium]